MFSRATPSPVRDARTREVHDSIKSTDRREVRVINQTPCGIPPYDATRSRTRWTDEACDRVAPLL